MKALWLCAVLVTALNVTPANAQTAVVSGAIAPCASDSAQSCFRRPVGGYPLGFQALSSLGTATGLTVPTGAAEALIICETQNVRWRDDGTAPTSSTGMLLPVNTPFAYFAVDLTKIQLIQTASSATCDVSYYK